jgi:hypothetical protein
MVRDLGGWSGLVAIFTGGDHQPVPKSARLDCSMAAAYVVDAFR